ncbi:MAG TPA: hypothetical protein VMA72_06815, partial [Streptosporangiaceae bacterium]|nr:hypothetical protein [Streptosporangiaceae bacterium]
MTDPGWDIPGLPRDASPGPDVAGEAGGSASCASDLDGSVSSGAGSPRRRRQARAGSVSASSGLSAGAFAPLPDGRAPAADWPASSPGSADDGGSDAAASAIAAIAAGRDESANAAARDGSANAAARHGSAVAGSSQCGSSSAVSVGTEGTASASTASDGRASGGTASVDAGGRGGAGSDGSVAAGTGASNGPDEVQVTDPVQALAFVTAGLDFLAHASPAEWPEGIQADCLRALAVAESQQTAAHATILQAFSVPGGGLAGDGHRSPRVWLTWQCAATRRAASSKVSWMHRLNAHPLISRALAGGGVSVSWAAQIMDWTRTLPGDVTDAADAELLAAAAAGATLADLASIAEELAREHARPDDDDGDDGFTDRGLRLAETFDGAGRLEGDLTPRCAAATGAVLGALSQPRG